MYVHVYTLQWYSSPGWVYSLHLIRFNSNEDFTNILVANMFVRLLG